MRRKLRDFFYGKRFFIKYYSRRFTTILIILSIIIIWKEKPLPESNHEKQEHRYQRRRLVVGILADYNLLNTLVNASRHTWIPSFPHDIYYFVGRRGAPRTDYSPLSNLIELPANDEDYPPINKTFLMWSYFYRQHLAHYDYFMSLDADSYINVDNFETMLNATTCLDCYVGVPLKGEAYERKKLGLFAPYCAGMGYLVAQRTLAKFGPHLDLCRSSTVSWHSDTEVGRCIYQHASGISCTNASFGSFQRVMFTTDANGKVIRFTLNDRKQLKVGFPVAPPTKFFEAALVHPIKSLAAIQQFHEQNRLQLRPILPLAFLRDSCVANPIIQNEVHPQKKHALECSFRLQTEVTTSLESITAFAIMTRHADERFKTLAQSFARHHLPLHPFDSVEDSNHPSAAEITIDQWKLRVTMARLLSMAVERKLKHVLVMEEHAVPHSQFRQLFTALLNDHRCRASTDGGALLLGAKISAVGWKILDKFKNTEKGVCRNICTHLSDSIGAFLHHSTFEPILAWLKEQVAPEPFDRVYVHLSKLGFPVRFAFPNLLINHPNQTSLTLGSDGKTGTDKFKEEAMVNHWELENYSISL